MRKWVAWVAGLFWVILFMAVFALLLLLAIGAAFVGKVARKKAELEGLREHEARAGKCYGYLDKETPDRWVH